MLKLENGTNSFYQWDLDQRLIVTEINGPASVHFWQEGQDNVLEVEPYDEDGKTMADVPNILLQKASTITAYIYRKDIGQYTSYKRIFQVFERERPAGYMYTETEVRTWAALYAEMAASNAAAQAAQTSATEAKTAASTAAGYARAAVDAANAATEIANAAGSTADNVKAQFDNVIKPQINGLHRETVKITPQELTDAQKEQARKNIGAGTPVDVHAIIESEVNPRLDAIDEAVADAIKCTPQELTEEQKAQARKNIGAGTGGNGKDYGAVRFDEEQNLSFLSQHQARRNIGAVAPPLYVTVTQNEDGTFTSSMNGWQIRNSLKFTNGGTVYCVYDGMVLSLWNAEALTEENGTLFYFSCSIDGLCFDVMIDGDAVEASILDLWNEMGNDWNTAIKNTVGEIDTALDGIIALQESLIGGDA